MHPITRYIQKAKINQSRFAAMIGEHRRNVSSWIVGRSRPSGTAILAIHAAFGGTLASDIMRYKRRAKASK